MKCKYANKGCKAPIPINCGDYCVIRNLKKKLEELEEEYTTLQQTYDACYNEHMRIVQQNKQLQAKVKNLEDLAEFKEMRIRMLFDMYKQLEDMYKQLEDMYKQIEEETKLTS